MRAAVAVDQTLSTRKKKQKKKKNNNFRCCRPKFTTISFRVFSVPVQLLLLLYRQIHIQSIMKVLEMMKSCKFCARTSGCSHTHNNTDDREQQR